MGIRIELFRSQSNADPANYLIKFCKANIKKGWEIFGAAYVGGNNAHCVSPLCKYELFFRIWLRRILKTEVIDQNNVTDNESRLAVLVAWSYLGLPHPVR